MQHKTLKHQGKVSVPKVVFKLETHKVGLREQLMPLSNAENGNCKLIISSHFASQLLFSTHQLRYINIYVVHIECRRHTKWVFFTHISSPVIASQSRLPPLERTCQELYFMCQRRIRKCNTKRQNIKDKVSVPKVVFKLETHKVGLREQLIPLSNAENGNCKLIISSHFASQLVFSTHQLRYMKHPRVHIECKEGTLNGYFLLISPHPL
jgi:hypothetical protein